MQRRLLTMCLVGALALSACTSGDGDSASPTEPADATSTATDEPSEEDTSLPRADDSETEEPSEEPTEEPSEDPEPTADPEPTEDAEPTPVATATATAAPTPAASPAATPAASQPASEDADDSFFVADDSRHRDRASGGDCPVAAADDEEILACAHGHSRSNGSRETVVVHARAGASESVTVYDDDGRAAWQSTLVAQVDGDDVRSVRRLGWDGGDDVFVVAFPFSQEIIATDAVSGSRVAGVLGDGLGGLSIDYAARRVIVRMQELGPLHLDVYEITADGLVGTRLTAAEDDDRIAEDVALRVYKAWVTGNPRAAADFATEEVLTALEATPQSADAFEMVGTSCPLEDGAIVCRFRRGDNVTAWSVRPDGDVLKVVALG